MEIAEIKERLSILAVLNHYGLQPDRNKRINCPFHNDKNPSMQVYPETNTVHCFSGNCEHTGKAIDQIDFILHKEKCTKHEAINKAKSLLGVVEPVKPKEDLEAIFHKLKAALPRSKKVAEYLKNRALFDMKLDIGYNNQTHYKHLKNCVVFPLRNQKGEIASLYGRSLTKGHYYLENRTGLYPNYPSQETQTIILTESIIDAATVNKYTDYQALALYGTNGLTQEHTAALKNCKQLQEVILFLDGDTAGQKAVEKYSKQLNELLPNITISNVTTPEGEDPNSLVQSHESEILNHLIDSRTIIFSIEEKAEIQSSSKLDTSNQEYITWQKDNLLISILGGVGLHPLDKLKVTLKIERIDSRSPLHSIRHSLDLYHDDQSEKLIRKAAERLETGSREMQLAVAELTQELENYRLEQVEQQKPKKAEKRFLTKEREGTAIKWLSQPNLLKRTGELIGKSGMVGEETNRLLMYLVFTSRLREQPLHIISLGASGTGKTYLQEKIAELIPEEHKLEITTLSENALYYFERTELKNKLVLIEDLDGANDDKILYAIRELMSKKRISKTIPIKDAKGNMKTITLQVEGPICLAGTTTREKLYEDNANRSLLVYLDNSKQHKESIMDYQRGLSAGTINRNQEEEIKEFFKDVQSVLQPVQVRNPYATQLIIPDTVFKPLRTNAHYLNFIEVITFYKQWQRHRQKDETTGEKFIETTLEDIEEANQLLKDVLLVKSDELTKGCRDFFERLKHHLNGQNKKTFYSQEVRLPLRMSPNNLKYYLSILVRYHLVKIIGGHPRKKGYEYEITSNEEYKELQNQLSNALDAALAKIKAG
ncbi:MAG: toprim domain-containing protein [Flavobacteriaceae bacterium]|nr:toprim domain-containing protein [Flavobacteriaceae bacterium]